MRRKAPLRRKTRIRPRSTTSKYARRPRNFAYMAAVRRLECLVSVWVRLWNDPRADVVSVVALPPMREGHWSCEGPMEADHLGERPFGQKAADETCGALCRKHHRHRTDFSGVFSSFTQATMRQWVAWALKTTARMLPSEGAGR